MRSLTLIILMAFSLELSAQTVKIVRDNAKKRQLESMVFMRWSKAGFRPQWYYILNHNRYRKGEDRRTLLQLVPTMAFVKATKNQSDEQKEDTETIFNQEVAKSANIEAESHYHLHFKPLFDNLNSEISTLIGESITLKMDAQVIQSLVFEQTRLNDQLKIIRQGYLEKGDSSEGMTEIEIEFKKLKAQIMKLIHLYKVKNSYPKKK